MVVTRAARRAVRVAGLCALASLAGLTVGPAASGAEGPSEPSPAEAPVQAGPEAAADDAAGCDGVWRPAPLDDSRAPLGPGLSAPSAVGLGEPFVAFLRHTSPPTVDHWQLGLSTTSTFGISATSGPVPDSPELLRMCLRITNPTAVGKPFNLSVGEAGAALPPSSVGRVAFRLTDPQPGEPCAAPLLTTDRLPAAFVAGPVFNGQPSELYPGRRTTLMVVAGGMTAFEWTLATDEPTGDAPPTGAATVDPLGFVHALCLDGIPASWSGHAATLRLSATDQAGVVRETATRFWVGDPSTPCDGVPRPVPSAPADAPAPSVTGPAEVVFGAPARYRLALDPMAAQAPGFGITVPAAQVYAGIPTGGPLIGVGTVFEVCLRPLDADAVGRHFDVFLGPLTGPPVASTSFIVTPSRPPNEPPAPPDGSGETGNP